VPEWQEAVVHATGFSCGGWEAIEWLPGARSLLREIVVLGGAWEAKEGFRDGCNDVLGALRSGVTGAVVAACRMR